MWYNLALAAGCHIDMNNAHTHTHTQQNEKYDRMEKVCRMSMYVRCARVRKTRNTTAKQRMWRSKFWGGALKNLHWNEKYFSSSLQYFKANYLLILINYVIYSQWISHLYDICNIPLVVDSHALFLSFALFSFFFALFVTFFFADVSVFFTPFLWFIYSLGKVSTTETSSENETKRNETERNRNKISHIIIPD